MGSLISDFGGSSYIVQFNINADGKTQKRSIRLTVNENIPKEKIKQIVDNIILNENLISDASLDSITITQYDAERDSVQYTISAKVVSLEHLQETQTDIKLVEFPIYRMKTQVKYSGFLAQLVPMIKKLLGVPVIGWIIGNIWPKLHEETERIGLKELTRGKIVSGPDSLHNLLEVLSKDAASQSEIVHAAEDREALISLSEQAEEAAKKGKEIQKALKEGPQAIASLAERYSQEILEESVTIPLGYYRKGIFVPFLITFSRNEEGKLIAQTTNLDKAIGKKIVPFQSYIFNENPTSLAQGLAVLFEFLKEPKEIQSTSTPSQTKMTNIMLSVAKGGEEGLKKAEAELEAFLLIKERVLEGKNNYDVQFAKAVERLDLQKYQMSTIEEYVKNDENEKVYRNSVQEFKRVIGKEEKSKAQYQKEDRDVIQVIDSLIQSIGGIRSASEEQKQISSTEEGTKILFTWMKATQEKRLAWETNFIFNYIDSFLLEIDRLSLKERDAHLIYLEKSLKRLEKHYKKEFGSNVFEEIWGKQRNSNLSLIRDKIRHFKIDSAKQKANILNHTISEPSWPIHVADQKTILRQPTRVGEGIGNNYDFDTCQALFEEGLYVETAKIATKLLLEVPSPLDPAWEEMRANELDEFSKKITSLTQFLWESQFKLNKQECWPDQVLALVSGRAALAKIMQKRVQFLWDEIKVKKPEISLKDLKDNPQELGALALEIGMSQEDLLTLALDKYVPDVDQIKHLLHFHPYLRFGRDPGVEKKLQEIEEFFNQILQVKPLMLDSWRNTGEEKYGDKAFILKLQGLLSAYTQKQFSEEVIWASAIERGTEKSLLPSLAIDLRRHTLFMQSLLHPESTITKGFGEGNLGFAQQAIWATSMMRSVLEQEGDIDQKTLFQKANERYLKEQSKQISQMGHMMLAIGESAEEPVGPCIQIIDKKKTVRLEYQPTGMKFLDPRNPLHDAAILGKQEAIPKDWVLTEIGLEDAKEGTYRNRPREQRPQIEATEVSIVEEEKSEGSSDLGVEADSLIRGLVIRDGRGNISPVSLEAVFDFIFNHPDLIEIDIVQRMLEQTLTQVGMIRNNPGYFTRELSERLKQSIEYAIKNERLYAACYLMHVGELVNSHLDDNGVMPTYETDFLVGENQTKQGTTLLTHWVDEQKSSTVKKLIYTYLLEHFSHLESLTPVQWSILLKAYAFLVNNSEDVGSPTLQRDLINWVKNNALPSLESQDDISHVLEKWTEMEGTIWNREAPHIYQSDSTIVNLVTGMIQRNGQVASFETTLPDEVINHLDYERVFGNNKPMAQGRPSEEFENIYIYEFILDDYSFSITHNRQTQEIEISRQIDISGEVKTFTFQSFEKPETEKTESNEMLLMRYGLWRNLKDPSYGFVMLGDQISWTAENLAVVYLTRKGEVKECRMSTGQKIYNDQEKKFFQQFAFARPEDTLFLYKPGTSQINEIRFLSCGITLKATKAGEWIAGGKYANFRLVKDERRLSKLIKRFGDNFQKLMLPLEYVDAHEVRQTKLLLFSQVPEASPIEISMESGKIGATDEAVRSTTVGWLMLASNAFHEKNYEQGIKYLKIAQDSPFNFKEAKIFESIIEQIRANPDESLRGIAWKLKAEIAIRKIMRDQLNMHDFRPANWQNYLEKIQKDVKRYETYKNKIKDRKEKEHVLGDILKLTKEEEDFFLHMNKESMLFLVEKSANAPNAPLRESLPYHAQNIDDDTLKAFAHELSLYMSPSKKDDKLDDLSPHVDPDDFLSKFWSYAKQISEEQLLSTDRRILKLQHLIFEGLDEEKSKHVDVGRHLLVQLAKLNDARNDLEALKEEIGPFIMPEDILFAQVSAMQATQKRSDLSIVDVLSNYIKDRLTSLFFSIKWKTSRKENPQEIEADIVEALKWIQTLNNRLQKIEENLSPELYQRAVREKEEKEYHTSIHRIKELLKAQEPIFTKEEKFYWENIVKQLEEKYVSEERIALVGLLQGLVQMNLPMAAKRHEAESAALSIIKEKELSEADKTVKAFPKYQVFGGEETFWDTGQIYDEIKDHFDIASWKPKINLKKLINDFVNKTEEAKKFEKIYQKIRFTDQVNEIEKIRLECRSGVIKCSPEMRWYLFLTTLVRGLELETNKELLFDFRLDVLEPTGDIKWAAQAATTGKSHPNLEIFFKDLEVSAKSQEGKSRVQERLEENLISYYQRETDDPMERHENQLMLESIEQGKIKRLSGEGRVSSVVIRADRLDQLSAKLEDERYTSRMDLIQWLRLEIVRSLQRSATFIPSLTQALLNPDELTDSHLFERILDLYKSNRLRPTSGEEKEAFDKIEGMIDRFLLEATILQQIYQASLTIDQLRKLKVRIDVAKDPELLKSLDQEWGEISLRLQGYLINAFNKPERYIIQGKVVNPEFSRKHLVAEYRSEMVAREYQPKIVEELVNGNNELILLPPGAGKSKWILPEAAFLFAEQKGKFPVILVIEELLHINRLDMDKSTREMFRQASHVFDFKRNTPKDVPYLIDEYNRLLSVKESKGYVISTIGSFAALEDELPLIREEMTIKLEELQKLKKDSASENEILASFESLVELQKKEHWLMKIRDLFQNSDTQYIADEVDDIFNINRDYNYSILGQRPLNAIVRVEVNDIMKTILSHPQLQEIGSLINENNQANLSSEQIREYMEKIAQVIYRSSNFKDDFSDEKQFVKFVTGQLFGELPEEFKNASPYVTSMKRVLGKVLPDALKHQKAGVHYGVSSDGYTVVPKTNSLETPGVRFGDEYELIVYHYLNYASKPPSREYFLKQWRNIQDRINAGSAPEWKRWFETKAIDEDLYEKLCEPESWPQRFALLNEDILAEKIKVYNAQVKCNAQDPLADANVSGMSGTINMYALQEGFHSAKASDKPDSPLKVDSRDVMKDTLLLLAKMDPEMLGQPVEPFEDALDHVLQLAQKDNCRSIIDQGATLEGLDALSILTYLRDNGIEKQLLFIHPKERKQWMWNRGDIPRPYDGRKLDSDCVVYFGPADSRGTDWPIPLGESALFLGPATLDEEFIQAIWRSRRLGIDQTAKIYIHQSVHNAHNLQNEKALKSKIELGDLMQDIKRRTLEQRAQNNYKAATKKVQGLLPRVVRKEINRPYITEDPKDYWNISMTNRLAWRKILSDIATQVEIHKVTKKFSIQEKKVNFEADLAPAKETKTIDYLTQQFVEQKKEGEQLVKSFEGISGKVNKILETIFFDAPQMLRRIHKDSAGRVESTQNRLRGFGEEVDKKRAKFEKEHDLHEANLKQKTVVSEGMTLGGSQEQVQEQQQQQQQQQQMVSQKVGGVKGTERKKPPHHVWTDWIRKVGLGKLCHLKEAEYKELFPTLNELALGDCGFDLNIHATINYKQLWDARPTKSGDLFGHFAIVEEGGVRKCFIIDKQDYRLGFADLKKANAKGLYALAQIGDTPYRCVVGDNDVSLNEIVQIEIIAGKIHFNTDEEKEALETWIASLNPVQKSNLKKFIAKAHGLDQAAQIPGWHSSILNKLLI